MKAQCCICADQFENDDSINIAAVPCGHTFHEVCVMRWLKTSNSCPQCRTFINKRQVSVLKSKQGMCLSASHRTMLSKVPRLLVWVYML